MPEERKNGSRDKKTEIEKSRIGVMGDHAEIHGGIHFHYQGDKGPNANAMGKTEVHQDSVPATEPPSFRKGRHSAGEKSPKVFISYAREDRDKARQLCNDLKMAGATPWLDEEALLPGQKWKPAIRQAIKNSDYFIVLLSSKALTKRGFVQAELKNALEVMEEFPSGAVFVIPARLDDCGVNDEALLQLNFVDLFPDWDIGVAKIIKVVLPDGIEGPSESMHAKEPRPRLVPTDASEPGWALEIDCRYYIERKADADVLKGIRKRRGLVTVQGPRRSGKTSLMVRLFTNASQEKSSIRPVLIDFESFSQSWFDSLDACWKAVLNKLYAGLGIGDVDDDIWNSKAGYDKNVTEFLERFAFANEDIPVLVCMDAVDRVFFTPRRSDFFSSLRYFFNKGAYDSLWGKIRWLLSTSSEPRFFIDNLSESPFNVGNRVCLDTFTSDEIDQFAHRYGFTPDPDLTRRILEYVGGWPYLVHLVCHRLALDPGHEAELFDAETAGGGVFQTHLEHYLKQFQHEPELATAMKEVIASRGCKNVRLAERLASAGLVNRDAGGSVVCSCRLYADYLGGRL